MYVDAYRSDCAFGAAHAEALRSFKVLLVPGYFADLDPAYFADQLGWLAAIGVEREKVAVKSREGVVTNAPIVAAAIRNSAKRVILITHSKGSVDALEALRAEPSLRTKVAGWLSLQGAFLGSPIADMLLDPSRLDPLLATAILQLLGGTKQAAQGLTTQASLAYYSSHTAEINKVIQDVPMVAFASAVDTSAGDQTQFAIPLQIMAGDGVRSDGLVPINSQILPGMNFVRVSGVDHIAPVMPALQPLDRVRMAKALLIALGGPFAVLRNDAACTSR